MEEGGARTELVAVADGATDDAAQHEAAPFIAGDDTVGKQEGAGADMVGKHAQRRAVHVRAGSFARSGLDQVGQEVNVVIAVDVLQHGGDTFQPHAGIDRRLG